MADERTLLLVNPSARGGRGAQALARARPVLDGAVPGLRVVETTSLEHAASEAATAAAAGDTVVAVGGDGLVGRVAGAVRDTPGRLGIIPAGRGNDFARFLGLPLEPDAAARALLNGSERMVDMGEANGRAFVGIVSVGFDSVVNEEANRSRLLRGEAVYVWTAVRLLAGWRHALFRVSVDGTVRETRGYAVGVANSGAYGAGMIVAPDACLDDGRLDAFAFAAHGKVRFLRDIPRRRSSGHVANPAFSVVRGAIVTIEADRPFPVYADGEAIATLPVEVRVCPSCLRVVAPGSAQARPPGDPQSPAQIGGDG